MNEWSPKHLDPCSGPFIVQARVGRSMVKCLNLDAKKGNPNKPWNNREIFVEISVTADLEMAFAKALKE